MKKVTLVENGRTDWRILSPTSSTAGFDFAAKELRRYVQKISGGALRPVGTDDGKPAIVIGLRSGLPPTDAALLPPAAKGFDGYAVAVLPASGTRPARIVIGSDNGPGAIYAVYDLLERLGCRWFYPPQDPHDPEIVPTSDTLVLDEGAWAAASPMKYRICNGSAWFFEPDSDAALKQLDWAAKNRYNAIGWQTGGQSSLLAQYEGLRDAGLLVELERRAMFLHGPGHSFDQFLRAEDHMSSHPEWFGLRDGKRVPQANMGAQFCWSNPGARREFVKNARAFITQAKAVRIFYTIPFDGGVACACDECKRIGASNLLMTVAGELTDMLAEARPDALLEILGGYAPVTDPPTGSEFHPRLRVLWAHWGRYHGLGYDDPRYDRKDNLAQWRSVSKAGITIGQYYTDNFAEPWVMPPFTVAMLGDRKYFIDTGVDSVYILMWAPGYWWNHGLNAYLAGRMFYDGSADPYKLIADYARDYFGKDAGPLIGAYLEEWARDPDLAYRVKDDAETSHRVKLADQRRKYIDPAAKAAAGRSGRGLSGGQGRKTPCPRGGVG